MTPQQAIGEEQVRRTLARVFERPEFGETELPLLLRAWRDLQNRLFELLGRVLGWLYDVMEGIELFRRASPVVFFALVALGTIFLALALWSTVRALRERLEASREGTTPESVSKAHAPTGAEEWERRAREALAEGRLLEAAHALYAALILRLEARGAVETDPSKTPGDYRREATRRDAEAASLLDGFLRRFEPFVFGGRVPSEGPLREMAALARSGGVHV